MHLTLLAPAVVAGLRDLARVNPAALDRVVDAFERGAADRLADATLAIERRDALGLARAAHALKGSASTLGATVVAERSAMLERAAHSGSLSAATAIVADLPRAVEHATRALRQQLAEEHRAAARHMVAS
jgi:HPt (histidine-containing phosphotransfer) domain-containing protein